MLSPTEMDCPSPRMPKNFLQMVPTQAGLEAGDQTHHTGHYSRRSVGLVAELGFSMDKVQSVKNLSNSGVNARLTYYPDPVVYNFTEENAVKKFKGEVLIFEVCSGMTQKFPSSGF